MFIGVIIFGALLYSLKQIPKIICNHPWLLTKKGAKDVLEEMLKNQDIGMVEMLKDQDIEMGEKMAMNLADMAHDDNDVISCKLAFITPLLVSIIGCMPILLVTMHLSLILNSNK
jgi:hypothetical protein